VCSGGDQSIWCLQASLYLGFGHVRSDFPTNLVSARFLVWRFITSLFTVRWMTKSTASLSRSAGQICPIHPAASVFICNLPLFFLVWSRFTRSCAIFSVVSGLSVWRLHSGSQFLVIFFVMDSGRDRFSCGFTRHRDRCAGVSGRIRWSLFTCLQ
jgi:hypothetical protein